MAIDRLKHAEQLQTAFAEHVRTALVSDKGSKKRKLREETKPIEMWTEKKVKLLAESAEESDSIGCNLIVKFGFV